MKNFFQKYIELFPECVKIYISRNKVSARLVIEIDVYSLDHNDHRISWFCEPLFKKKIMVKRMFAFHNKHFKYNALSVNTLISDPILSKHKQLHIQVVWRFMKPYIRDKLIWKNTDFRPKYWFWFHRILIFSFQTLNVMSECISGRDTCGLNRYGIKGHVRVIRGHWQTMVKIKIKMFRIPILGSMDCYRYWISWSLCRVTLCMWPQHVWSQRSTCGLWWVSALLILWGIHVLDV